MTYDIHQDIAELRAELADAFLTCLERAQASARLAKLLAKTTQTEREA